jgi:hypothetical protein
MAPPKGTPKPPGSGRRKGTPNRVKTPSVRAKLAEMQAEALERTENALGKLTPLEFALQCMRDESNPPGFRLEACKVAMPYVHAKVAEQPSEVLQQITEIRRIIVSPREVEIDEQGNERLVNEGRYSNGDIVEPSGDPVDRSDPKLLPSFDPRPDPVAVARSRLDRMRGMTASRLPSSGFTSVSQS